MTQSTTLLTASQNVAPKSTSSPVYKWLHEHPYVQKTATVALGLWGLKTIYDGLQDGSFYIASWGAMYTGGAYLANKILPVFVPPAHNPENRVFQADSCRGVSLYFEGNMPVLQIPKSVSAFDAGFARGYMMAAQLKDLREKNDFVFHTLRGLPRKIPHLIAKMKEIIPSEYITELNGLVAGYNEKRTTWKYIKGTELTLDELIYFHMVPDVGHMDYKEADQWVKRSHEGPMGCTTVIDGDQYTGPRAIRTVDWFPMDVYGKYAFVELRETTNGMRYANQSYPCFIGCLTAMNKHGFCAAMNVARGLTKYPEKLPAVFYLRRMIETCTSLKGEGNNAQTFWQENAPLGPFNLTVLDRTDAASVHFYQKEDQSHNVRWWQPGHELITLNFQYGEKGETNATPTNSAERKWEIENFYREIREDRSYESQNPTQRVASVLKGSEVNNIRTISAAFLYPHDLLFETSFDNGYAADRPLKKVPTKHWFC